MCVFLRLWCIAAVVLAVAAGVRAQAQSSGEARRRVIGEVLAADSAARKITVRSDAGGEVTVVLDDKTVFLRVPPGETDLRKAVRIQAGEIGAGDRVLARGTLSEDQKSLTASAVIVMTKADLTEKQARERAEWRKRGVAGAVTALNPETKEITLAVRDPHGARTVTVETAGSTRFRRYAPDSVRFRDARPSSFAEMKPGDQVRVLVENDPGGARVRAEEVVSGSFRNVAVLVNAVDPEAGEIRVTDLATKKPLVVRVSADSMLRRMPEQMAEAVARRREGGGRAAQSGPPGQGAPPRNGAMDFQQALERMPALSLAELKRGEAVIVSSTAGADPSRLTAIVLVAGVEPLLRASPEESPQLGGMWNFEIGLP